MRAGTGAPPLPTLNRSRARTLALQLSIDRERGRSHYNSQISTLNSSF
ncbi:MAG: hypothetical protein ACRC62_31960 [Microcoleus sp.]